MTLHITHYTLHINGGHYALTKTYQQRKFEQQNKDHDHDHYLDYHHHIHRQPPCVTKKKLGDNFVFGFVLLSTKSKKKKKRERTSLL
jgi:hypothetical protein